MYVFAVDYSSQADIKVFVTKYASQADLLVFKVDYSSQAKDLELYSLNLLALDNAV